MGNLHGRRARADGARLPRARETGSTIDLPPGRNLGSDRGRSRPLRSLSASPPSEAMMTTQVAPIASSTALLMSGRSDQHELEMLLRGVGFQPVLVDGADQVTALRDPVSLCLID